MYLGSVELVLTPRCNLRCRYCANLMPYYSDPVDISREILISGLQSFLAAVDGVGMVRLLGGEPLLVQNHLRAILKVFNKPENQKVMGLQIVTNGSLLFEEETLQLMKVNPLIAVYISNYDFLEVRTKALIEQLESCKIPYILCGDSRWQNFGNPSENYGSEEQRIIRFRRCKLKESCNTILDGFFYVCPRQAHGAALGIYPPNPEQRVWLMEKDLQKLRKEIYQMHFRQEPVTACFSCKEGEEEWVRRAEQINKSIKLNGD